MRTLYLDCNMGAAGDMLTAALLELVDDKDRFLESANNMGLDGVKISAASTQKCGIHGTSVKVMIHDHEEHELLESYEHKHNHEHEHTHSHEEHHHGEDHEHTHTHQHISLGDIEKTIASLKVSQEVREAATAVYWILAKAEAKVHGASPDSVHFHEVGMLDAVADIVNVCALIAELAPDKIIASPINTGSGTVHCAHGIMPVPAPATAAILQGMPVYQNDIKGELCTPTGAALLKYFVDEFGPMPIISVDKIGYGMGHKDFPAANCIRTFIGDTDNANETVVELSCNLDDMTPEDIGYATEHLLEVGALDVYLTNIIMKKSRPGVMLNCLCYLSEKDLLVKEIFKHTSTLGIRETQHQRYVLERTEIKRSTEYGDVRVKNSAGYNVNRMKPEYDDLKKIANRNNIPLSEIRKLLK